MKIGIIGLGLIGGSFALAAKKYINGVSLYGQDYNPENLTEALQLGILDYSLEVQDYAMMDIIVLAIPVDASLGICLLYTSDAADE